MKYKSFKYKIYPTQKQQELIIKHFGVSRFIWNYYLNQRQEYYLKNKEDIEVKRIKGGLNYYDNARDLTILKKQEGFSWISDVNTQSLQSTLKHLDSSYKMFFRGTHNFPQYKSKEYSKSYTIPQFVSIEDGILYLPKFREGIKINIHRKLEGTIRNTIISQNKQGHYFVSITCECEIEPLPIINKSIGIDLGIKTFAVCSDGVEIENPKHLKKKEGKLKYLQRKYSKYKGEKTKKKLCKTHGKVANQRKDFLHKTSTQLIRENQIICIEDLNIKGILSNNYVAKSASDCGWGMFINMLEYKSNWYGRTLVKVDRWFPSSKMCNKCGWINQELQLKDRERECKGCGDIVSRDFNASKNILQQGLNMCICI